MMTRCFWEFAFGYDHSAAIRKLVDERENVGPLGRRCRVFHLAFVWRGVLAIQ
jgi:hypothetical protein